MDLSHLGLKVRMVVADVLVIGGGIAGASLAYRLAEQRQTVVLEAENQPGYHSTGRSAALFTTTYGHPVIRGLTLASRDFLAEPPEGFTDARLLAPRGALWIAREDQAGRLDAFLRQVAPLEPTVGSVSPEAALGLCPALDPAQLVAAVIEPNAADIEVSALHQGFIAGLRRRGGALALGARVREIRREAGAWRVATDTEVYVAPVLVNAAGAWADEIAALARVRPIGLVPKRRTAVTFDPPAGMEIRDWPCVLDADEEFYFKPDAGRILASPADETPAPPGDAQAEELDVAIGIDRVERATLLRVQRIVSRWAGLRCFVADKVPVVGPDPDAEGFHWLAGQGGYGIMTSPALSAAAAALVLDEPLPAGLAAYGVTPASLSAARLRRPGA